MADDARLSYTTDCGIPGLGKIPWGSHFCQVYSNRRELVEALVPYFQSGLRNDERCLWIAADPLAAADAEAELGKAEPGLARMKRDGRIEIRDAGAWYSGVQGLNELAARWLEEEERALAGGYRGLRIAGNAGFLRRESWDAFMAYENAATRAFRDRRIVALCSYDFAQCEPTDLFEAVRSHFFTFGCRDESWQVLEPGFSDRFIP